MRLYLNPSVIFKSKETFSCIYNNSTGWYYPCNHDFWKTLQTYKRGVDLDERSMPPALSELVHNLFLIKSRKLKPELLLEFYPLQVPGSVFYQKGGAVDVAVERKGAHGEIDFDVLTLEKNSAELWRQSSGTKPLEETIRDIEMDTKEALEQLKIWTNIENQLIRLLIRPVSGFQEPPPQLVYKAPFLPRKTTIETWAEDVQRYHLDTIKDGGEQFERIESTLSHLYRVPHPILNDKSYGQAIYTKINEENKVENGSRILEVGGGAGNISADMLEGIKQEEKKVAYIIYDLSPALIRAQKKLHHKRGVKSFHIHGNGEALALKDDSIDIAFSNEAIADFTTPIVEKDEVQDFLFNHEIPMTTEFFHPYQEAPEKVRVNLGAFFLLKELYRVLKPGGLAFVTEFGFQDRLPFRAKHLDHAEYSIQFSQMISVATALGFNVYLADAFDFLGFKADVKLITGFSYQAAFRLMEHRKVYLPNITYTKEMLKKELKEKFEGLSGLGFVEPILEPFKIVKVLVCRKPTGSKNI